MDSGRWVIIIAFVLGILGLLIGRGFLSFPWKDNISEEHRGKELKKVFRSGVLLILLGLGRLLAYLYLGS
jgi:hypothetical protein